MIIQRRYAPIRGHFEPESVAGLAGIHNHHDRGEMVRLVGALEWRSEEIE